MKKCALVFGTILAIGISTVYAEDSLLDQAKKWFKPIPSTVPELKENLVTPEKVGLGKMLFFEPRLSKSGAMSCNTCHNVALGGADGLPVPLNYWGQMNRNTPTVFNAVFNTTWFWDGRVDNSSQKSLDEAMSARNSGDADPNQSGSAPIVFPGSYHRIDFESTPSYLEKTLGSIPGYMTAFVKAFPDDKHPLSFKNMTKALEAFQSTLLTPGAPLDRYLNGDINALTAEQQRGLKLFIGKGCVACHHGINIGGHGYYPFGLVKKPDTEILPEGDKGHFVVTKTESDQYAFRASPLRNIALTAPYFHSGQIWDLEKAVALMGTVQIEQEMQNFEIREITAFLYGLTGEQPEISYPVLPPRAADTPRPSAIKCASSEN